MSAQSARGYLGISEVLAQLRPDFPDVSVSKIRFLETEGLITPARSAAGYRRFCAADVDLLRYILTAQRDQYLPLRVIREQLDQSERHTTRGPGGQPGSGSAVSGSGGAVPGSGGAVPASRLPAAETPLTRRGLIDAAGISEAMLTELETFGLLRRAGRHYAADAVEIARTAVALAGHGVEARHLRAVRAAAEREATMIESLVAPIQRQRGTGAREMASRTAAELAGLVLCLHAALVRDGLAEAGLAEAGLAEAGAGQAEPGGGGRGMADATA